MVRCPCANIEAKYFFGVKIERCPDRGRLKYDLHHPRWRVLNQTHESLPPKP